MPEPDDQVDPEPPENESDEDLERYMPVFPEPSGKQLPEDEIVFRSPATAP